MIDIGVMSTTLLEIGGGINGDQSTGRVTIITNGRVLTQHVHNYTKDHSLTISLTFDSDWQQARDIILTIVRQEVEEITKMAEDEIERLGEKYYFPKKSALHSLLSETIRALRILKLSTGMMMNSSVKWPSSHEKKRVRNAPHY